MNKTQSDRPTQPTTVQTEGLFDRMGQQIGYFTALATHRIQRAATSIREAAERLDQSRTTSGAKLNGSAGTQAGEAGRPVTGQAEKRVDRVGQRISHYTVLARLQIQRAAARVREEAEDMWVGAQNLRRHNDRKPS
jgi:hypothetical protein